ncbi:hypothetical protein X777_05754 [Ooceraea biroi]|uniref:Histone-lysine N-methyltransferase SETMAR n=1 Tax=Ooceraea biroi TaxID=2015173 RepID=A0A026WEU0_OOCBI|nr:hypothetical protein X777_05754 [Ooceraea biroi]
MFACGTKFFERVRPEYREQVSSSLLHNNIQPHKSTIVRDFLVKKGITLLESPLYLFDLAWCDFWLFPKLKLPMREKRYNTIQNI